LIIWDYVISLLFGRKATEKDLDICMFNRDGTRYTIASFEYDEDEHFYYLEGCADRLKSKNIDWEVFGLLVQKAYKILEENEREIEI